MEAWLSDAKEKGMSYLVMAILVSTLSFATVTISQVDCPQQFEGSVQEMIKSVGPGSAFETQTVIFKNLATIKGDVPEQVAIEMLAHGPFEMEQGIDYRVQVKNGRICWIEKI
jgi:hypothetical protein